MFGSDPLSSVAYATEETLFRPVTGLRTAAAPGGPRDVVTAFVPEYVLDRWWSRLLYTQSELRLTARLLFTPGVMVTSVPYHRTPNGRNGGGTGVEAPGGKPGRPAR